MNNGDMSTYDLEEKTVKTIYLDANNLYERMCYNVHS